MTKFWQFYYNALFGAIGGLVAWLVIGLVPTAQWTVHMANAFAGAGIGFFIGGALGTVEGLVVKRSIVRVGLGVFLGTLVGLVGGALGLTLGGFVFTLIQGGLVGRMLGWMALGFFLGLSQGIAGFKLKRIVLGLAGGTLAGLIGGGLFEVFTQAFLWQSAQAQVYLSAIGLVLIGVSLGLIIPATIEIARQGLIRVLSGSRAKMEVSIIAETSLGSSDAMDVYIPDPAVEKNQAVISRTSQGFVIRNIGKIQPLIVEQSPVFPGNSATLGKRAQLQLGSTLLEFRAR